MTHPFVWYVDHLEAEAAAMAQVLAAADPARAVPACPGWDLAALVSHLGGTHRWATTALTGGDHRAELEQGPADPDELRAWYAHGATRLVGVLRATAPDAPCWTFGPPPRTAAFWARRQALETLVHRRDAEQAIGEVTALDPALARDGVDEVATVFFPRQVRLGRIAPLPASLALAVLGGDGGGRVWVLAGDGTAALDPARADATVRGDAPSLLLLLWGRLGLDDGGVTVSGDSAAAQAVLSTALVP
jgi:uncharacterized protein (TIGR03083 family)